MNRAQRRSNPTAWAATIAASRQTEPAVADDVMTKLHMAFADLKAGSTDDDLFDRLAVSINVGLLRAEQINEVCVQPMLAARDALIRCDDIRGRHGRYGFDGPGLQAIADGLDVYEEMLRKSTPQQMTAALYLSVERMRKHAIAPFHTQSKAPR